MTRNTGVEMTQRLRLWATPPNLSTMPGGAMLKQNLYTAAIADMRLSGTELRVLIGLAALASARGRSRPTRRQITETLPMRYDTISRAVSGLAAKGWLTGGRQAPCDYQIVIPHGGGV